MRLSKIKGIVGQINAAPPGVFCLLVGLLLVSAGLLAQTPEEHSSHHPAAAGGGAMPASPGAAPAMPGAGGMGGMMDGMGEMMKGMMGAPPPKELYPTLMALPALTPEQRTQVEQQASERMHAGTRLMGQALDTLNAGTLSGDYAAMHEAMTRLREGAAQLESGIAARRALAEGRAPRAVALAWFKQEMSLVTPAVGDGAYGNRGLSPLHLFTMALLVAFAAAMLAMYFFKMRRAAALFGRIEPGTGSPPPGSSPPLGGAPGPSAPTGGKAPSTGETPAASTDPGTNSSVSLVAPPVDKVESPKPNAAAPLKAKWAGRLRVESIVSETSWTTARRPTPRSSTTISPVRPSSSRSVACPKRREPRRWTSIAAAASP